MRRVEFEDAEQRQQKTSELSAPADKNSELKKQSQFMPGEIDAKPFTTGDYDKMPSAGDEENKANLTRPEHVERSQFHAAVQTEPAGKMEEPVAAAAG